MNWNRQHVRIETIAGSIEMEANTDAEWRRVCAILRERGIEHARAYEGNPGSYKPRPTTAYATPYGYCDGEEFVPLPPWELCE